MPGDDLNYPSPEPFEPNTFKNEYLIDVSMLAWVFELIRLCLLDL
jgi:hypothetical protein